jgi:hypothetical protein
MSGTGNEHPDTDAYVETVKALCAARGVEFFHLTPDLGYHTGAWKGGLVGQWTANSTIGSASYPPSCSDSLKISPIWRFIEDYVEKHYGYQAGRKAGLKAFVRDFGKIRCILGIAKGEETRVQESAQTAFDFVKSTKSERVWFTECVERVYPLIDLGLDRAGCQAYIRSVAVTVPPPSNCMYCAYKSKAEVLWTARTYPDHFAIWLKLEDAKRAKWAGAVDKNGNPIANHGVKGTKTLREFLAEAETQYGHWTAEQLDEYRFSHGHCTTSKF